MSKATALTELNDLHRLIARVLKERLETDAEDGIPTDAATLGVVTKFLKDNQVFADPANADDLADLRERLKAQSQGLRIVQTAEAEHLKAVGED